MAPSFSPASLGAGLLAWYDETSWTKSGSNITAWNDLSGNGRTLSPSGTVTENATGGPNSGPCIECAGASAGDGLATGTWNRGSGRECIYMVVRPQSVATGNKTIADGQTLNQKRVYTPNTSSVGLYSGSVLSLGGVTLTAWQLVVADFNGASSEVRAAGASNTGNAGSTGSPTRLSLAGALTSGQETDCRFVEVVVATTLDARVVGYLQSKWGVT